MPSTKRRGRAPAERPIAEPGTLGAHAAAYGAWMEERHYSPRTVRMARVYLGYFAAWAAERGIVRPSEVTLPIVERYQRHLFHHRKANGKPLSWVSQAGRLGSVKGLFRYLVRQHVVLSNPASDLVMPRPERRLPKHVLTASEMEAVLAIPYLGGALGLRDRALLEMLYATGMRRSEVLSLKLDDVDLERGTVVVRQGKNNKDRVLPVGERAMAWLDKYLREVRAGWACGDDEAVVFLGHTGLPLAPEYVTHRVREIVEAAKIGKRGSCHLFRHTMATLMLENGADVRYVQEMLGHASLETTSLYTRVSIRMLTQVHAATHPGAKLEPRSDRNDGGGHDAGVDVGAQLLLSLAPEEAEEEGA